MYKKIENLLGFKNILKNKIGTITNDLKWLNLIYVTHMIGSINSLLYIIKNTGRSTPPTWSPKEQVFHSLKQIKIWDLSKK